MESLFPSKAPALVVEIHVAAYLVPGHKRVDDHRSAGYLGHQAVGQPDDPVDLSQPEAEEGKRMQGQTVIVQLITEGSKIWFNKVIFSKQTDNKNSCLLFQINQEVYLYHGF